MDEVLDGIAGLKPRQGDVSDLREQLAAHMRAAGFAVELDAWIADRGDGRTGKLDLWCSRMTDMGSSIPGDQRVAIELDGTLPRQRSAEKLRRVDLAHRVLVLRTGVEPLPVEGVRVIAMGWGNKSVAPSPVAAAQQARASVGASSPPASTHQEIGPESVRRIFALARERVKISAEAMGFDCNTRELSGVTNPLHEWDEFFGTVEYVRHEPDTLENYPVLYVSSLNAISTSQGLHVYGSRLNSEIDRAFGPMEVRVEARESG